MSDNRENPFSKQFGRGARIAASVAIGAGAGVAVASQVEAPQAQVQEVPTPTHQLPGYELTIPAFDVAESKPATLSQEKSEDQKKTEALLEEVVGAGTKGQVEVFMLDPDATIVNWNGDGAGAITALPRVGTGYMGTGINGQPKYFMGDPKAKSTVKYKNADVYEIRVVDEIDGKRIEEWWLTLAVKPGQKVIKEYIGRGNDATEEIPIPDKYFALIRRDVGEVRTDYGSIPNAKFKADIPAAQYRPEKMSVETFKMSQGKMRGEGDFNPRANFNGDDVVNVADFSLGASQGKLQR